MPLNPIPLILKKRDGGIHSGDEIRALVTAYVASEIPDYQMSAWLMAAFLRGLDDEETNALTQSMLHSGRVLDLGGIGRPRVDKHSTGGVGDKISLCLAPAVAACGVAVPMIAGRGLGHTGGTLDKLESIPGYRTNLEADAFERIVRTVGTSIIGQTHEIAPADARIYALRDVTGTVESIPLIVASILSKKLAEGIDALVLDVKVGKGAFMSDLEHARTLADALIRVGTRAGKRVSAILTDMSAPIGLTIGNALETREAIEVLRGAGPEDVVELTLSLGAEMLVQAHVVPTAAEGASRIRKALDDGSAFGVFRAMVEAHGGDPRSVDDTKLLPTAPHRLPVAALRPGFVQAIDAHALGLLSVSMGAGRTRADQAVDPAVGIELRIRVGDHVETGEPLGWLHARTADVPASWLTVVEQSVTTGDGSVPGESRVLERRG
jgi:pyrimidine-nucleoside phosphorylase